MTAPALQRLIDDVADAVAGGQSALAHGVTAALEAAVSQSDWIPPDRRRANHENYARHILYSDPAGRFSILSIVWGPGQQSRVHAHHTWCGVGVYQGTLTETFFQAAMPPAAPTPTRTVTRGARSLSFDRPLNAIHRIANTGTAPAISLHAYGVGRERIAGGVNKVYEG